MEQEKSPGSEPTQADQQASLDRGCRCEEGHTPEGVFFRHWKHESPRFVVLLAHGLGEHSGRYEHVASALALAGATTLAPDHIGHGRSPGHRCYVDKFETYFNTLDYLRKKAADEYSELPCFIVGHSMGGLIVSNYLIERKPSFSGAVFSGAAFQVPQPPSKVTLFISKILSMIAPRMGVMQLDASEVSRDPQVVADYVADPLVHSGKISAGLAVQ
ncbi:MAG: lysophospholipase, partial [Pseudomonadota bacterium]